MSEKKGTSATRAKNKYNSANYDQVNFTVPKGERANIDAAAAKAGLTRTAFIVQAIEEKIRRGNLE